MTAMKKLEEQKEQKKGTTKPLLTPCVSWRSDSAAAAGLSPLGPTASSLGKPTAMMGTGASPLRPVRVARAMSSVSYLKDVASFRT